MGVPVCVCVWGGGKVSCQRWRVQGGGCHLRKPKVTILKFIDRMVLKLTVYIRNAIPSLVSQNPVKFRYLELHSEIFNFDLYFTENRLIYARP